MFYTAWDLHLLRCKLVRCCARRGIGKGSWGAEQRVKRGHEMLRVECESRVPMQCSLYESGAWCGSRLIFMRNRSSGLRKKERQQGTAACGAYAPSASCGLGPGGAGIGDSGAARLLVALRAARGGLLHRELAAIREKVGPGADELRGAGARRKWLATWLAPFRRVGGEARAAQGGPCTARLCAAQRGAGLRSQQHAAPSPVGAAACTTLALSQSVPAPPKPSQSMQHPPLPHPP